MPRLPLARPRVLVSRTYRDFSVARPESRQLLAYSTRYRPLLHSVGSYIGARLLRTLGTAHSNGRKTGRWEWRDSRDVCMEADICAATIAPRLVSVTSWHVIAIQIARTSY